MILLLINDDGTPVPHAKRERCPKNAKALPRSRFSGSFLDEIRDER